jgi:mannose-1-phosphate guanylyltransferase
VDQGDGYQVKRITVNPGAKLSVQMHYHRAEHWVVVSGSARVTNGDKTFLLQENESTYIPVGTVHCLENAGELPLEIIEIQLGAYLGEDDIVRFSDVYGRVSQR